MGPGARGVHQNHEHYGHAPKNIYRYNSLALDHAYKISALILPHILARYSPAAKETAVRIRAAMVLP